MSAIGAEWETSLFGVGDPNDCLYAWFCTECALASARTRMDGSDCCFNFFCLNSVLARWMTRTAYNIPGDSWNDCIIAAFCPCCSTNQLLQQSKNGFPVSNSGRMYNTGRFRSSPGACTPGACLYATFCTQCAVASALNHSTGMPWLMGFCCSNMCLGRNVLRYQYRIAGQDLMEECFTSVCFLCVLNCLAAIPFCCWLWMFSCPPFVIYTAQMSDEAVIRSREAPSYAYLNWPPAMMTETAVSSAQPQPQYAIVQPQSYATQPAAGHAVYQGQSSTVVGVVVPSASAPMAYEPIVIATPVEDFGTGKR